MGTKTRITDKGIVTFRTDGLDRSGNSKGFSAGGDKLQATISSALALTADQAGSHILSSSSALSVPMPIASSVPGSRWVFRCGSAHAHTLISGSSETTIRPFTDGTDNGGQLALENVVGSSVVLMSDGANWLVLGRSGSLTISECHFWLA